MGISWEKVYNFNLWSLSVICHLFRIFISLISAKIYCLDLKINYFDPVQGKYLVKMCVNFVMKREIVDRNFESLTYLLLIALPLDRLIRLISRTISTNRSAHQGPLPVKKRINRSSIASDRWLMQNIVECLPHFRVDGRGRGLVVWRLVFPVGPLRGRSPICEASVEFVPGSVAVAVVGRVAVAWLSWLVVIVCRLPRGGGGRGRRVTLCVTEFIFVRVVVDQCVVSVRGSIIWGNWGKLVLDFDATGLLVCIVSPWGAHKGVYRYRGLGSGLALVIAFGIVFEYHVFDFVILVFWLLAVVLLRVIIIIFSIAVSPSSHPHVPPRDPGYAIQSSLNGPPLHFVILV